MEWDRRQMNEVSAKSLARIASIRAREVLDSRGNPTVEAEVTTEISSGRASVPSGASKGAHEAIELRDGDAKRFHGRGVLKAVSNVNKVIAPKLRGVIVGSQRLVDERMVRLDGTPNKSRLGANAILAVSMAAARSSASARGVPLYRELRADAKYRLPVPMMNIINGGEHAGNGLSIQEFMIEPVGADSCSEAIRMGAEVYHSLKSVLSDKYGRSAINVGDEGGFAPPLTKTRDALDAVVKALKVAGYAESDIRLGIDAASTVFFDEKNSKYELDERTFDPGELADFYSDLQEEYALLSIEDPFSEEAFADFASITSKLGRRMKIIGDDIYVTNIKRIKRGIRSGASNGVLVKLNQIGTVSETEAAIDLTKRAGWVVAVSHRSGETEDPFIAHLATATRSEFIKTGAPARGERTSKYNELIRIEEELGSRAEFAGKLFRR